MEKQGGRRGRQKVGSDRRAGGDACEHLWPIRVPILQWISEPNRQVLERSFEAVAALSSDFAPEPANTVVTALAADVAWLADYLAWIGAHRENADLKRRTDLEAGLAAEAAAGWLDRPVQELTARFGELPPTWNEEEALRRTSALSILRPFCEGLEWMASLAYVTDLYYEPPAIPEDRHLPMLLEAGKAEAAVLQGSAESLANEPSLLPGERRLILAAAEVLGNIENLDPAQCHQRPERWKRRPAVPSRRT